MIDKNGIVPKDRSELNTYINEVSNYKLSSTDVGLDSKICSIASYLLDEITEALIGRVDISLAENIFNQIDLTLMLSSLLPQNTEIKVFIKQVQLRKIDLLYELATFECGEETSVQEHLMIANEYLKEATEIYNDLFQEDDQDHQCLKNIQELQQNCLEKLELLVNRTYYPPSKL